MKILLSYDNIISGGNVTERSQVELFLSEFRRCWPPKCMVISRSANIKALAELGLTPKQRCDIILSLTSKDFVKGPVSDQANLTGTIWIFGKRVNGTEIYIKLKMYNVKGRNYAKCISFHKATGPLKYPFK